MKLNAICCLLTVLGTPAVFAQESGLSPDPSAIVTGPGCRAACEAVYADCETQCRNTSARAHERAGETPDLPVDACLEACAENLRLCKEDC
jgi:hypothetical protein